MWIWGLLLMLVQNNPNALMFRCSTLSVFLGNRSCWHFLGLAWPNTIQTNSQSAKKSNFCFLSYFIKLEDMSKVSAVRSGLDIMRFNTKLIFSNTTVYGAKWPAHMFTHWNQMSSLLGSNLTAGQDKYDAQQFCMFLCHISGCPLQQRLRGSIQLEKKRCHPESATKA